MLSDTTGISIDSVKRMIPAGFFVLSEKGARKSIKAAIDADAYYQKWKLADEAASKMATNANVAYMERNRALELNTRDAATIQLLQTKLKNANTWKWVGISVAAVLATKMIIKP